MSRICFSSLPGRSLEIETIWDGDSDVSKASTALSRLRTFGKQYKIRELQIEHYTYSVRKDVSFWVLFDVHNFVHTLTCDQALLLPFLCWRPSADFLTWNHPPTHQKQTNKQKPDRRLFTRTNEPMIKFLGSCHTLTGTWLIARIIRNIVGHLCSSYIVKLSNNEVCVIGIIEMLVSYIWYSCCFVLLNNNIIKMIKNCVFVRGVLTKI